MRFANLELNRNNSNNGSTKILVILLALLILNSTVVLENNFKSNSNCDWQKTYNYSIPGSSQSLSYAAKTRLEKRNDALELFHCARIRTGITC